MRQNLSNRLQELHELTNLNPLFNPAYQLSLELSRKLESDEISLNDIESYIRELECDALKTRAEKLKNLLAPMKISKNLECFKSIVINSAKDNEFPAFSKIWSKPLLTNVFTAHPTFLLNRMEANALAKAASSDENVNETICVFNSKNDHITLNYEHEEALEAIERAFEARNIMSKIILEVASKHYPDEWQKLRPKPFDFATWVGYDMDGRTDISWSVSLSFRLMEKSIKLSQYAKIADSIGLGAISKKLEAASQYSLKHSHALHGDLSSPIKLSQIANEISEDNENKILSLKNLIAEITEKAKDKDIKTAREYIALAAAMESDGLGVGNIHFRLNAAQLNNAIRSHCTEEEFGELSSQTAIKHLDKMIRNAKPLRTNFAALAIESTTALRIFLAMAQILKHVDNETPIRLLIAECEQPQTVLIALYFAKLFGIENKIDISPLFETETAMEHGARFLDALMADENYRKYVRGRGRLAIQTGFSDAGRFIGQLPASLAIERLHGRLARIMSRHDLDDVSALIFNTHGESMGRGAHPNSIDDRLNYNMSKWARYQFASRDIDTILEVSFQGGDGYLFFRSPELALATLTRIAEVEIKPVEKNTDPFYTRTDISLDFYRGIRREQRKYLDSSYYSRAITAFGLGLLKETGSRKSRRQSDISADRDMSLRQIRAIPHNAILQQLGFPVNLIAGAGNASKNDTETIKHLLEKSERGMQIIRLINASNNLASIKTLSAYGELFNCAFWAARPYRGTEQHLENACLALAEKLENDDRPGEIRRLASSLRVDLLHFQKLIQDLPIEKDGTKREDIRRSLGVLQAIRLCLMQYIFLKAIQIPAFSRRNDISRDDILEMIFTLRIEEAMKILKMAFPISAPSLKDFSMTEATDYPKANEKAYEKIHIEYFDEIEKAYSLIIRIGVSIANYFGAHG